MENHVIGVRIEKKKFLFGAKECLCVQRGDTIKWTLRRKLPFSVVVKALVSPLNWSCKAVAGGQEIIATVKRDAAPGLYTYAFSAFDGEDLLIEDPEIIIRPPREGK